MTDRRDPGSSEPRPAGAQPRTPDHGQPRKPRIEVLRGAPAATASDSAHVPGSGGIGKPGRPTSGSPLDTAPRAVPESPTHFQTFPGQKRRGLFRSRAMLLMLLASLVIASFLMYTYITTERDGGGSGERTETGSAGSDLSRGPETDIEGSDTGEPSELPGAVSDNDVLPDPEPPAPSTLRPEAAGASSPEPDGAAVAGRSEELPAARSVPNDETADASETVRAFYSALSAGDGSTAAQLVVPSKRRSGPLSAAELSRYYSSFRRPLLLQSLTPLDADTIRVTYDYVLSDGRLCRGRATVNVVQRDGRSEVSGIRTRGAC